MEQCWEGEKKLIPTDTGAFLLTHNFFPRGGEQLGSGDSMPAWGGRGGREGRGGRKAAQSTLRKALGTANHLGLGSNASKHVAKSVPLLRAGMGAGENRASGPRGGRSQNRASTAFRSLPVNESLLPELERSSMLPGYGQLLSWDPFSGPMPPFKVHKGAGSDLWKAPSP